MFYFSVLCVSSYNFHRSGSSRCEQEIPFESVKIGQVGKEIWLWLSSRAAWMHWWINKFDAKADKDPAVLEPRFI